MHIQHSNPNTESLSHGGRQYKAIRDGIFEVPDDVAQELLVFSHWRRFEGDEPYEVRGEPERQQGEGDEDDDQGGESETRPVAYEEGRLAAVNGVAEEDSPYGDKRTKDAKDWRKGWAAGKAEAEAAQQ